MPIADSGRTGEGLLPASTVGTAQGAAAGNKTTPLTGLRQQPDTGDGLDYLPVGAIPLMATQCATYQDTLKRVSEVANRVYREFLDSAEGRNFCGQVLFVRTCV